MLKTVVLLNICILFFFSGLLDEYKVQNMRHRFLWYY